MKKVLILLSSFAVMLPMLSMPAMGAFGVKSAHAASYRDIPLAIIRFNQPRVYFQRPLSNAVRSAMEISPDLSFKIVHYTPASPVQRKDANKELDQVVQQLYKLGVRPDRLAIRQQAAGALKHSEVHLYIQ